MKYYSLTEVLPVEVRREVYTKCIDILEEMLDNPTQSFFGANTKSDELGLCILLPCILYNLEHYLDKAKGKKENWWYGDTPKAFPEVKDYIDTVRYLGTLKGRNERRIEILKTALRILK